MICLVFQIPANSHFVPNIYSTSKSTLGIYNDLDTESSCFECTNLCALDANDSGIYLSTNKFVFSHNETVDVAYTLTSNNEIVSFAFTQVNATILSSNISSDEKSVVLELIPNNITETTYIHLEVTLDNQKVVTASFYSISNDYGIFISSASYDDAYERYFEYALARGILTESECQEIRMENWSKAVTADIELETPNSPLLERGISTFATSNITAEVSLNWIDDNGNTHKLRKVKVEVYHKTVTGDILIGTASANERGQASFSCSNITQNANGKYNVFFRIYAGDDNAMVKTVASDSYFYESTVTQNITTGTNVKLSFAIGMSTDLGKAFQISQALLVARDYANTMLQSCDENAENFSNVTVAYPAANNTNSSYTPYLRRINLIANEGNASSQRPPAYASWDVIAHEYGHHIQSELNTSNFHGLHHTLEVNLLDSSYNEYLEIIESGGTSQYFESIHEIKPKILELIWSESWATVFAILSQQYHLVHSYISNIPYVGDDCYTSYSVSTHSLEICEAAGEGCEDSVMAILYDIYDDSGTAESSDTIALGHIAFWNITAMNERKMFSEFVQDFYAEYPEYIDDLGLNLTSYEIASRPPAILNTSTYYNGALPVLVWTPYGGSTNYPNNSFYLIFYDDLGVELFRTARFNSGGTASSVSYEVSQSEWNQILQSTTGTYIVAVVSYQTTDVETGPYVSRSATFTIPSS